MDDHLTPAVYISRMTPRRRDLLIALGLSLLPGAAAIGEPSVGRRLSLKNVNTGESFDGEYRDAEGPVPEAIADLTIVLRDHHANKTGPLDVGALDFLADVMEATGQTRAMILSAYRTPETNAMLAKTTFGVAEKSQHMYGRALDVTFDSRLSDAETVARRMRRGGVGWYPRSHFVHIDTGPVRNWDLYGAGFATLLAFHPIGGARTVADRMALHRALARREFLMRHR